MSAQAQNIAFANNVDGNAAAYLAQGKTAAYGIVFADGVAAFIEREVAAGRREREECTASNPPYTAYKTRDVADDYTDQMFTEWVSLRSFTTLDEAKAYVDTLREMDDDDSDDWGPNPPTPKEQMELVMQEKKERYWDPYGDDDL